MILKWFVWYDGYVVCFVCLYFCLNGIIKNFVVYVFVIGEENDFKL